MLRSTIVVGSALLLALSGCSARSGPPAGEEGAADDSGDSPEIALFENLGGHTRAVTTASPRAQAYFDQGLNLTYGFNHDAAARSFAEALRLDPACGMCAWGFALALGPNINLPVIGPEAAAAAYDASRRASELAPGLPEGERRLIAALSARYSADPQASIETLRDAYAVAMHDVHEAAPEDDDVATLYAASLMNKSPWDYWSKDGKPHADTGPILETLEAVMARSPKHPGANHYYIHAVEASNDPGRAVASADRLVDLVPGSGHLVHMSTHIYWRVGRYEEVRDINRRAAEIDEEFFSRCRSGGMYGGLYYPHNIHFRWAGAMMDGDFDSAMLVSQQLKGVMPDLEQFPSAEDWVPLSILTLVRFGQWDDVLAQPQPTQGQGYTLGVWHYARGLSLVRRGMLPAAELEFQAVDELSRSDALQNLSFVVDTAADYLAIGRHHLAGELAAARGDTDAAITELREAVRRQEAQEYTEPPPWYFPLRQALGAVLLDAGRAAEAEAVYRKDLEQYPRNGWSLYGLAQSLRAQDRADDAALVEAGFRQAWSRASVKLTASRF